jgi:trk system potassium uptake protein TrkH
MLVLVYGVIVVASLSLMRTRDATPAGNELSVPRTVFTVMNAASLTGFQQTITVDSYKPLGQRVIFTLIVAGSLLSMIVGAAAVVRLLRLPYSMGAIVFWAIGVEAFAVALGTAVMTGNGRDLFDAAFQAASAFGNCGVVIGRVDGRESVLVHLLIFPLAVVGGIGLPVLMELFDWVRAGRRPSNHTRVALAMTAGVYLIGIGLLTYLQWPTAPTKENPHPPTTQAVLRDSSTMALNARTLGWPVESPATWPRAAAWAVLLLMTVGASPAGTGGGIKTTTLYELGRGTYRAMRSRPVARVFGFAGVWLAAYVALVLVTTMRLVSTEPQLAADQILFTSISAASNVGLSYAPVSITGGGLYTLSVTMMLGRLLPLVILWWAALTTREADVAVG